MTVVSENEYYVERVIAANSTKATSVRQSLHIFTNSAYSIALNSWLLPHHSVGWRLPLGIPIPYREIADLLREGQAIPFLGAGASLGNRPTGVAWDETTRHFLPRGDELSLWLASIISFPSKELYDQKDLAKVSSYFSEISGRDNLIPRLHKVFYGNKYIPCDIHFYLAELAKSADIARQMGPALLPECERLKPTEYKPLLIVTTNYDNLTETALQDLGCPFDLVVHPTDNKENAGSIMLWKHGATEPTYCRSNTLEIDLNKTTVIYKMHGTVSNVLNEFDSYVITEEDYIEFIARMTKDEAIPKLFITHFYTRQFLFLGYGLKDWNFRVMMKTLKERSQSSKGKSPSLPSEKMPDKTNKLRKLKSWAIQNDPTELETVLWTARDVILFKEDLNEFVAGLRRHSPSLVRYINSNK